MYQVLARKYRPKTFDEVIGQDDIVKTLKNAVDSDRIAHAYIFSGTRGVGKTSIARILARSINCEKGPASNPCGVCHACVEMLNGNSVDIVEIDGASNTGVDDIRELKENIMYSPQSLKYKIYIIDEVHMLSKSAFNALLKTLEEPPEHVKFIFATTEIYKVPETILSRCQRFTFKRIAPSVVYLKLKEIAGEEKIEISDENLMTIASLSDGSLRDALSTFDTVISYYGKEIKEDVGAILGITGKDTVKKITEYIFKKDYESSIKIINDIYIAGTDIRQFIRQLAFFLRNILVLKLNYKSIISDMLETDVNSLIPLAELKGEAEILDMIDILLEADGRYQRVTSPLLMMELVIFRLITTPSKMEIKAILEKLDNVDKLEKIDSINNLPNLERKYSSGNIDADSINNINNSNNKNNINNISANNQISKSSIEENSINTKDAATNSIKDKDKNTDKDTEKNIAKNKEKEDILNKSGDSIGGNAAASNPILADGEDFLDHIDSITNKNENKKTVYKQDLIKKNAGLNDSKNIINSNSNSDNNDIGDDYTADYEEYINTDKRNDYNSKLINNVSNIDNKIINANADKAYIAEDKLNNNKGGNSNNDGAMIRNLFEEIFDGFIEDIKD
ncbi:MAG: DNA polymerase III subunit gamma/tau [bacterium]